MARHSQWVTGVGMAVALWAVAVAAAAAGGVGSLVGFVAPSVAIAAPEHESIDDSASVVRVSVLPGRSSVLPGEVVPIAVILDHDRRWYTQAGGPDSDPESIPTTVSVSSTDQRLHVRSDATQWPTAEHKPLRWAGPGASVAVYSDRAILYVPVEIRPDASPGVLPLTVTVGYQACDDRVCLEPVRGQRFSLQFVVLTPDPGTSASVGTAFEHPEFFTAYRSVAPQLEPVALTATGIPGWIHITGASLLVAAAALAIWTAMWAGMHGPATVLLLRAAAASLALVAVILWIAFAVAG